MATIRKRGERYFVEIRIANKAPARKSFTRLTDARIWAEATASQIRNGKPPPSAEARRRTFAAMIDRYLEDTKGLSKGVKGQLTWWRDRLGDRALIEVTTDVIIDEKTSALKQKSRKGSLVTGSTFNRRLAALSKVYTMAVRWRWVELHPIVKQGLKDPEPEGRVRFLSAGERGKLLAACQESTTPLLYPFVLTALSTGMRASELLRLQWTDIDVKTGSGWLNHTKNGTRRAISISGPALPLLQAIDKKRAADARYIFADLRGKHPKYHLPFRAAVDKAEIENFRFHDLRHSCASELAMNGAALLDIANILGHKSLKMTQKYSHLSDAHIKGVLSSMTQKIFGTPAPAESAETTPTPEAQ